MMTLRCTQKLLDRLPLPKSQETIQTPTSSVLGDWYVTLLFTRPAHLILGVSEHSRLCVLLPARELGTLAPRFCQEVGELLRRLGATEEEIAREVSEMSPTVFGSTTAISRNRSMLGTMNDYTRMTKISLDLRAWSPMDLSVLMSETPCGPIQMRSPNTVTLELLRQTASQRLTNQTE